MPEAIPPIRPSQPGTENEFYSPASMLRSFVYFSFSPRAFSELGVHFPWLRRTARLANWVNRLDLASAGLLAISLVGLATSSLTAAGLLLLAALLPTLLHVGFAIWDESPLHELLQRAVVPMAMLLILSQTATLGPPSWWLLSAMLAVALSAFLIVVRGFYEWPLYLLQANVVVRQSRSELAVSKSDQLMELSDELANLIVERLARRNWLLRRLIRETELPTILRAAQNS